MPIFEKTQNVVIKEFYNKLGTNSPNRFDPLLFRAFDILLIQIDHYHIIEKKEKIVNPKNVSFENFYAWIQTSIGQQT